MFNYRMKRGAKQTLGSNLDILKDLLYDLLLKAEKVKNF